MTAGPRARVRQALDELKPYLRAYVQQNLQASARAHRPARDDVQAQLGAILEHWESVFSYVLPVTVRHYVFELKDVRNRWAHEEDFSEDEARRAADTARFVAKAIGAPESVLTTLARLATGSIQAPSNADSRSSRPHPPIRVSARTNPTTPKLDRAGVILNAEELSADEVAMKRVLCPACRDKVFEEWSAGWDAHAAHRCTGLTSTSPEERKEEYRTRFQHLFRAKTRPLGLRTQRDVMREIWLRCKGDPSCAEREYAAAEQRNEVVRVRNTYSISAEAYARALIQDGLRKGWLT